MSSFKAYWHLMRFHRPIGTFLLMWPALIALWMAGDGHPSIKNSVVFILGVILMRAAGCTINDIADRNFDGHVARTKDRPLATKALTVPKALILFFVLVCMSFLLVLQTNLLTIQLSFAALLLAAMYPFMKRIMALPQVVLGAAFACAIPMAFSAETNQVPYVAWILFFATVLLALAYDTLYAMVDREDDLKIGIQSTAILFGRYDRMAVACFQCLSLSLFALAGVLKNMGLIYFAGIATALVLALFQHWQIRHGDLQACFRAFLNHQWIAAAIFLGTLLSYIFD